MEANRQKFKIVCQQEGLKKKSGVLLTSEKFKMTEEVVPAPQSAEER